MKVSFDEKHVKWGVTAFLVILCSILVFFIIYRVSDVSKIFGVLVSILTPFIYGLIMAYLLCPVYNFTLRNVYRLMQRPGCRLPKKLGISKGIATTVAIVMMLVIIGGVLWMIIPGLLDSIMKIIRILPSSMDGLKSWLDIKLLHMPQLKSLLDGWINNFTDNAIKLVTDKILPEYGSIATKISEGVIGVFNVIKNFFIGIIICAYFLNSKDTFAAQIKKIIASFFKKETADEILAGARFTNRTFGGFINGKIIDSAIIGVLCFIFMTIFGWEYTLLISCIIGITNIIPFFGPFIGAIPSAMLLLMVDTRQCIYFVIFILLLQQFDGNILGPKILGDTTGLASFWVLFSVLVGGGMFGFIGMVVGIPIFAVLYAYATRAVNRRLEKRGLSTELSEYRVDSYLIRKNKEHRLRKSIFKKKKEGGKTE